jgi:hypothetical protein
MNKISNSWAGLCGMIGNSVCNRIITFLHNRNVHKWRMIVVGEINLGVTRSVQA